MLITRPSIRVARESLSTCMYRASTTRSTSKRSTSSSSRASASGLVSLVTGTWKNGMPCHSTRRWWSRWLETTATISTGSSPVRARKSRSLRQCSNLETITSTRRRARCSCSSQRIPNRSATGVRSRRRASSDSALPSRGAMCTRMKKWPRRRSSYWVSSTMLAPCSRSTPLTACTIPGCSAQSRVSTSSVGLDSLAGTAPDVMGCGMLTGSPRARSVVRKRVGRSRSPRSSQRTSWEANPVMAPGTRCCGRRGGGARHDLPPPLTCAPQPHLYGPQCRGHCQSHGGGARVRVSSRYGPGSPSRRRRARGSSPRTRGPREASRPAARERP